MSLPKVDEAFPMSHNPFDFKIISPDKENIIEPKSPNQQIGKHLTFATNISVAQLQYEGNEGDFDFKKTTPTSVVSPTFRKTSDLSLIASAHFGPGHSKKKTAHFVEQSESQAT